MEYIVSGYGNQSLDISIASYDIENGKFIQKNWEMSLDSPSFVCCGDGMVFAGTEADYAKFHLIKDGAAADSVSFSGNALCHIAYSKVHEVLYGACYNSGNVVSSRVSDRKFMGILQDEYQRGRAHSVLLNKAEDTLYAANISLDVIFVYDIVDGMMRERSRIDIGDGKGPRHTALSADENLLYVITEYSNEIVVIDLNYEKIIQVISTLPANSEGRSNCSTLCFTPDMKNLLGANRFTDTIVIFDVSADGKLSLNKHISCGGKNPRHMTVTGCGRYAVVCNQSSDKICIIDIDSGEVTDSIDFKAPSGVAEIKFI